MPDNSFRGPDHDSHPAGDVDAPLPLDWVYEADQVPPGGIEIKRTATDDERAAVAQALNVLSCNSLRLQARLKRAPDSGYRLRGKLTADVVQACVVTLAPVLETVVADIAVEFRPPEDAREAAGGVIDLDAESDIEPMDGTSIPVGRITYEELVAGLNAYPRRPGASYNPLEEARPAHSTAGPFAILSKLKDKK